MRVILLCLKLPEEHYQTYKLSTLASRKMQKTWSFPLLYSEYEMKFTLNTHCVTIAHKLKEKNWDYSLKTSNSPHLPLCASSTDKKTSMLTLSDIHFNAHFQKTLISKNDLSFPQTILKSCLVIKILSLFISCFMFYFCNI